MRAEPLGNTVRLRAPAKVNLFLEVLGKRPDGYHEVVTFMVRVSLFDHLELTEEPGDGIRLTIEGPALPEGPENLVWRAADLLRRRTGTTRGAQVHLNKQIPVAAGLAGGSSDAAATLRGLNQLWRLELSPAQLQELAAELGSDVPFLVGNSAAWCTGRGERVTPFRLQRPLDLVLACPPTELATAEVYRRTVLPTTPRSADVFREALVDGSAEAIAAALHNRLQPAAEELCPDVVRLRELFDRLGLPGHGMSGSGSSYFALCRSREEAQRFATLIQQEVSNKGTKVFVVRTLDGLEDD